MKAGDTGRSLLYRVYTIEVSNSIKIISIIQFNRLQVSSCIFNEYFRSIIARIRIMAILSSLINKQGTVNGAIYAPTRKEYQPFSFAFFPTQVFLFSDPSFFSLAVAPHRTASKEH